MIRAYLTILHDLHVETWIAHGTLLGWWWNQKILPWDWDLDVQVSGQTLAYLSKFFNYTTHKYKSGGIEREYFLDVNPHYQERTRGDGENIIDARWIDVRNGLFIDITGISETNPAERSGIWSCKNEHDYSVADIWPLRESSFEGVKAMVPNAYDKVLRDEYEEKALIILEYEGYAPLLFAISTLFLAPHHLQEF
jgi:phosphorylcholine metabolism protein LicD